MKIYFSTLFDQETYPLNIFMENGVAFGARHMGPAALLDYIELHLGISANKVPEGKRILKYRNILRKIKSGSFYERSFDASEIEVARYLLSLRDDLKRAGWNFHEKKALPVRLKDLAKAEAAGKLPISAADRVVDIAKEIARGKNANIEEIRVYEPENLLPPFWSNLFDLLKSSGSIVHYEEVDIDMNASTNLDKLRLFALGKLVHEKEKNGKPVKITPEEKCHSLKILKVPDNLEAAAEIARLRNTDPGFNPLIVNERLDPLLSLALAGRNHPSMGTPVPMAVNPVIQQIHSISALLWEGKDVRKMADFLTAPVQIIPDSLRFRLAESFCSKPGINWQETSNDEREKSWGDHMASFLSKAEHREWAESAIKRVKDIFALEVFDQDQGAPVSKVKELFFWFQKAFTEKAGAMKRDREDGKDPAPFFRIASALLELGEILDEHDPKLPVRPFELAQYIDFLSTNASYKRSPKETGSLAEVYHPGLILGPAETLLWFDFASSGEKTFLTDRFSSLELEWLEKNGVYPDTAERKAKRESWFLTRFLAFRHKHLFLIVPATLNGEGSQPHHFMPYIEACFKDVHLLHTNKVENIFPGGKGLKEIQVDPFLATPAYWQIPSSPDLLGPRGKPESFSSMEKLVNFPYQWALNYKASLGPGFHGQISNEAIMRGNLAHKIFQRMLVPGCTDLEEKALKTDYRKIVDEELSRQGWYFLQQGHETSRSFFRERMADHFLTLLRHLKSGGWRPVGCEYPAMGTITGDEVKGYIDLLLEREETGEKAVIDLKWGGFAGRREEMAGNRDFQLAVYSALMRRDDEFIPTAYFILSRGMLLTRSMDAFPNGILVGQDRLQKDYSILLESIEASVRFRREELKEGRIEVGQGCPIGELDIYSDGTRYLPDTSGGKANKKKTAPKYDDYKTFTESR